MSIIETITDVDNTFLSRRELTCNFTGLGGKLKSLEAVDMVTKELKLEGKFVIPMRLKTHVGKSLIQEHFMFTMMKDWQKNISIQQYFQD